MSSVGNWIINVVDKFITITAFAFALNLVLLTFIVALSVGFGKRFALKPFVTAFCAHARRAPLSCRRRDGARSRDHRFRARCSRSIGSSDAGGPSPFFTRSFSREPRFSPARPRIPYIHSLTAGERRGRLRWQSIRALRSREHRHHRPAARDPVRRPRAGLSARSSPCRSEAFTILATWTIALLVCNVFINLAVGNESKFVYSALLHPFPADRLEDPRRNRSGARTAAGAPRGVDRATLRRSAGDNLSRLSS